MKKETKYCERHGDYVAEVLPFGNMWSLCPICAEERQLKLDLDLSAEAAFRRNKKISENLQFSGIPKKYANASISGYEVTTAEQQRAVRYSMRYVEAFEGIKDEGVSMVFFGSPGTGKTHLACAIALEVIRKGFEAKYITAFDLLNEISDTFRTSELTSNVVKKYTESGLLVLDEVGIQYGKDHDSIWLYKVINTRYVNDRPTIVISNLDDQALEKFLGSPTYDRLQEGKGAAIPFFWESRRRKQNLKMVG
ncbi:ATP-binding protein [Desulforegula conservatrix]|uniref:ATP-binding protein n=1 Tax=Desulforegula conservatrix TaxID=153026 RepID=UPI00040190C5|nr:ATP-binding protein [Desulforegula conservatrix]